MKDNERTKRNRRKRKDCLTDTEPSQQAAELNVFPTISTSNFQTNAERKKERKNRTEKHMKGRKHQVNPTKDVNNTTNHVYNTTQRKTNST